MTPVRLGVLAMATLAFLTSCSKPDTGPTAAQAGETLKSHITQVMRQTGLRDVEVTDPGGKDVSCGEGGTKRTYGARSTFEGDGDGFVLEMTERLRATWGYKVDMASATASHKTVFKLASSRTSVTVDMPTEHEITVVGETDCVPG
ncbi:hypothetical protein [Nonomuraea sp. JJY05]|uniref:hypothetical protein n=1 Tax=Nonomuraea sp. JJY05 TaxID=3350255 RepID=UPI00373F7181